MPRKGQVAWHYHVTDADADPEKWVLPFSYGHPEQTVFFHVMAIIAGPTARYSRKPVRADHLATTLSLIGCDAA